MEERKYPIGGFAPGNYTCKCVSCGISFHGDKRAVQCELCALEAEAKNLAPVEDESPKKSEFFTRDEIIMAMGFATALGAKLKENILSFTEVKQQCIDYVDKLKQNPDERGS